MCPGRTDLRGRDCCLFGSTVLAAIVIFANFAQIKKGTIDPGMTTEVAALLWYVVGALIVIGYLTAAVVIAGAMAVLLHSKRPLHNFARAVGERDMRAIMQFVLLSLVILPILPSEDYGPYGVWNPFKLWLMVVLIVGISLGGYVAYKFLGTRRARFSGALSAGWFRVPRQPLAIRDEPPQRPRWLLWVHL